MLRDRKLFERIDHHLVELRRQNLREKPLYQEHLRRLAQPEEMDFDKVTVGYAMEKAARRLAPRIVVEGDPSKPIMSMVCIGADYARKVELGTQTKLDYCRRHGYSLAILESPSRFFDRSYSWVKIPLLHRLMQMGYRSIFQIDADTLITNSAVTLETFFDRLEKSGRHLMLVEDIVNLNTGCFFIRRTWQAATLLDLIYETDIDVGHVWWEQQALTELVTHHPTLRNLLYLEPAARQFNSMYFDHWLEPPNEAETEAYAWHPGDFVCHLAGYRGDHGSVMQKVHAQMTAAGPPS